MICHGYSLDGIGFLHLNRHRKRSGKTLRCLNFFHNIAACRNPFQNVTAALCQCLRKRIIGMALRCDPGILHDISLALAVFQLPPAVMQRIVLFYSVCRMIVSLKPVRFLNPHRIIVPVVKRCFLIIGFSALRIVNCQSVTVIHWIHFLFKGTVVIPQKNFLIQVVPLLILPDRGLSVALLPCL